VAQRHGEDLQVGVIAVVGYGGEGVADGIGSEGGRDAAPAGQLLQAAVVFCKQALVKKLLLRLALARQPADEAVRVFPALQPYILGGTPVLCRRRDSSPVWAS